MFAGSVTLLILIVSVQGKPADPSVSLIDRGIAAGQEVNVIQREAPDVPIDAESGRGTSSTAPTIDSTTQNVESTTTSRVGPLTWLWSPFTQRIQFSPQYIQDRIVQVKEALGINGRSSSAAPTGKQLGNGLFQLAAGNDAGFYTDRLEPAGFFGGNGWLANKGGLLGGPGAILSTGSLLTDYPSPYRKK